MTNPSSPALPAELAPSAEPDPELLALPAPPKRERTMTVALMALTAAAALWMTISLVGEAAYSLTSGSPVEVGELAALHPSIALANKYVRAEGLLGTTGAIRYGRAAEGDSFRLAPALGNPGVWVEIRVPEGFEGPRFVPPTQFAGRLVPFKSAGLRHVGLARAVKDRTDVNIPDDAWVLIDGTSPRASRWALALALVFFGFVAWNVAGVIAVLRRVRTKDGASGGETTPA